MLTTPIDDLGAWLQFEQRFNLAPRYNIAPSQDILAVRLALDRDTDDGRRDATRLRWGLIPSWAEDIKVGFKMINARAETVARLPSYRDAYRHRRCLIPANGFFEWQALPGAAPRAPKQPFWIKKPDGTPFAFAGLWERWNPGGEAAPIESCTIITTSANERLRPLHHRMPVILDGKDHETWLRGAGDASALLRPAPEDRLVFEPISQRINRSAFDDPACLEPLATPQSGQPPKEAQGSLF